MKTAADRARALVVRPLGEGYRDASVLDELATRFRREGYVRLPGLLSSETLALIRDEIVALEQHAQAREFVMSGPDTPRVMSVLGASQLLTGSRTLAPLYVHFELIGVLSRLAGTTIHCCRHPEELMVCNLLLSDRSTHGWHLDDPPYALVVVLEAPAPGSGGELEFVPDWELVCRRLGCDAHGPLAAAVAAARADGALRVADHRSGDAYLLRADRCLHRVAPLRAPDTRRVALNFAYELRADASYGDSATVLYGSGDRASAR